MADHTLSIPVDALAAALTRQPHLIAQVLGDVLRERAPLLRHALAHELATIIDDPAFRQELRQTLRAALLEAAREKAKSTVQGLPRAQVLALIKEPDHVRE